MNTHVLKFTLNEVELTETFINSIKPLFSGKDIVLSISEKGGTEVLLHTYYDVMKSTNNAESSEENRDAPKDKGNPGSKGAGGGQPPKFTLEIF